MTKYILLILNTIILTAIITFQIFEARKIKEIATAFHGYNITLSKQLEIIRNDSRQRSILENELAECVDKAWRIQGVVDAMAAKKAKKK